MFFFVCWFGVIVRFGVFFVLLDSCFVLIVVVLVVVTPEHPKKNNSKLSKITCFPGYFLSLFSLSRSLTFLFSIFAVVVAVGVCCLVVLLFCLDKGTPTKENPTKNNQTLCVKVFCAIVFRGLWAEKGQQTKGQPIIKCFFNCCCFVLVVRATTKKKTKKTTNCFLFVCRFGVIVCFGVSFVLLDSCFCFDCCYCCCCCLRTPQEKNSKMSKIT